MTTEPNVQRPAARKKSLVGGAIILVVAAIIVVAFVLPAEFGIDPTGIGRMTGVIEISNSSSNAELQRGAKRKGVLTLSATVPPPEAGATDRWEIELAGYESVEFKYTIAEGGRMTFAWRSSAPLHYDMHAHPFKGGTALTESYGVGDAESMQGRYVAAFTGIHGWYWQNRSLKPVTLVLEAQGGLTTSTIFDSAGEHERPIEPPAQ